MNDAHTLIKTFLAQLAMLSLCQLSALAKDDFSQALSLYNAKDYKAAASAFTRLAQTSPGPTSTYYLALSYQKLNSDKYARDLYTHICKEWPDSPEAKIAKDYLNKVNTAILEKSPPKVALTISTESAEPEISQAEWDLLPLKTRIPYIKEKGWMMVNAKINGKYCKVVFDTGASFCTISKRDFPDVVATLDVAHGKLGYVSRPTRVAPVVECAAQIALQDINRKVKLHVIDEAGVSIIGQNFYPEYSYQVDDFYIRLTKHAHRTPDKTITKTAPVADKYSVPFERFKSIMLIEIIVNGKKVKAVFDTGCAADGIVCHPSQFESLGMTEKSSFPGPNIPPSQTRWYAERITLGPIIKMNVRAYPAGGLQYPLVGPKLFDHPYTVDQQANVIRFDY